MLGVVRGGEVYTQGHTMFWVFAKGISNQISGSYYVQGVLRQQQIYLFSGQLLQALHVLKYSGVKAYSA